MRQLITASVIVGYMGVVAGAQQLKVPAGCHEATGAKESFEGYADRIIHDKTSMELVLVPAGSLTMGIPAKMPLGTETKQTLVTLKNPFYMGKTEVTNGQYRRFVQTTGYDGKGDVDPDPFYDMYLKHWRGKSIMSPEDNYPVVWVSWKNAKAFCQWAGLALPSDSQWEYACRAQTTTTYFFGDDPKAFGDHGWANTSTEYHTHSVAGKLPNPWGLYDMLGNAAEWVDDDYVHHAHVDRFGKPPTDGTPRLDGKITKVVRGGCWSYHPAHCQSGSRYNTAPINASAEVGFRAILPVEGLRSTP
jgi:formylglycine-generating enzyme required for sulfatase activity